MDNVPELSPVKETNVTPMETSDCDNNGIETAKAPVTDLMKNGTSEPKTDDESVVELSSDAGTVLTETTKQFSQCSDKSSGSQMNIMSSQDEQLGEISADIALRVSSSTESNNTVIAVVTEESEAIEEDIESTLIAVAAVHEEKLMEMAENGNKTPEPITKETESGLTPSQAEEIYERCVKEEIESSLNDAEKEIESNETDENESKEEEMVPESKPVDSAPIEIVDLDDSDDEEDGDGSEAEEYGDTEEEYEDEYDEDVEMYDEESANPEPSYKETTTSKRLKRPPLTYRQRMKNRSCKWLDRFSRIRSKKKRNMQIMDDAGEAIECETKVPNHGSPEMIKAPKVPEEQNEEKENTDPLETSQASESLFSSQESKEVVSEFSGTTGESESKTGDDEDESNSKNGESIQLIDSDEESETRPESVKEEQEEIKDEVKEEVSVVEPKENNTLLEKTLLEDLGSDEAADGSAQVTEQNLYDDIESELKPHIVQPKPSVEQKAVTNNTEPMDTLPLKEEKVKEVTNDAPPTKEAPQEEPVAEKTSKRRRSSSPIPNEDTIETHVHPSKKLRLELEKNYGRHDKLLREYIEATNRSNNVDDVKHNIDILETEIKSLDAMLRAKEDEWNNILHMKLLKEEIRMRLVRRKETLEMKLTDPSESISAPSFQNSTPLPNKSQTTAFNAPLLQESLKSGRNANSTLQNLSQTVTMLPLNSSINPTTQSILQQRANMKTTDLAKESTVAAKIHRTNENLELQRVRSGQISQRNILPRPKTLPNHEQILRNLAMSSATSTAFQQQQLNELFNGHSKINMGRQGPTKEVTSIIADFREKNPDVPPRRGRRVKGSSLDMFLQLLEQNSRPSSADSSHSNTNVPSMNLNAPFNDILAQFAKMTPAERQLYGSKNSIISALNMTTQANQGNLSNNKPPPYPEVTLHPVVNANDNSGSSLLHGILTKSQNRSSTSNQTSSAAAAASAANFTNYSPTLARLLTSPERISSQNLPNYTQASNNPLASLTSGLNLSNKNSEITITPVMNSQTLQQTLLAQQQKQKEQFLMEDDNDDNSTDRLVIDEGDNQRTTTEEIQESEVPECQGCRKREAQFVCAGCGNQWYCSRECQVQAWDEHSENCSG